MVIINYFYIQKKDFNQYFKKQNLKIQKFFFFIKNIDYLFKNTQ
jgi:hypothetical protein